MYLVIDIGGSSIKYGLWTGKEVIRQNSRKTPDNWVGLMSDIVAIQQEICENIEVEAVSFSLPGIVNQRTGKIEGASSLHYIHQGAFRQELEQALGVPVFMENDANCASLAELTYGAAKGKKEVVFVVIGTGIGGTIINNGQIQAGQHAFAGEFGMMLIDGHREWAELGSAVHMARKVSLAKGLPEDRLSGEDVFYLADNGDSLAEQAVEELYHYLALGIYNLQYILDPELVVLGGGISKKADLLVHIERHLREIMTYGQRSPLFPKVVRAKFGNEANLLGAAINCQRLLTLR